MFLLQKKTGTKSQHPRAKATLYGLSSIKRSGDVTVNMMDTHTTVRTNFLLGPLVLKVEKEVRLCDTAEDAVLSELRRVFFNLRP